jgi:hypothetical protein
MMRYIPPTSASCGKVDPVFRTERCARIKEGSILRQSGFGPPANMRREERRERISRERKRLGGRAGKESDLPHSTRIRQLIGFVDRLGTASARDGETDDGTSQNGKSW